MTPTPPNPPNPRCGWREGWVAGHKAGWEARGKFERDKALKDKQPSVFQQKLQEAALAGAKGFSRPESRFPVIIDPLGPFSTLVKVQEVVGPPSLPEIKTTTKAQNLHVEEKEEEAEKLEEVEYTHVGWDQLKYIKNYPGVENLLVWFEGQKRYAYYVPSVLDKKAENQDVTPVAENI
ncbi:hypothetical protein PRK78_004843 [Emydomyces testavorans]|uniref:Uncharacterized protein n=1 Tax=Emydomyces testavorans TaxID=2070801 RepID=A0AAF0DIR4_9EURO|nr:hypothetical protein PRK78_004843 [Emydomyces testavorans]